MLSAKIYRWALWALFFALAGPLADAATLQGQLVKPEEGQPIKLLAKDGQSIELVTDELLDATMRDPQLADRTWEVRGTDPGAGRFEVDRAFTIKDGKRYRVTYYCEICHITTYDPGRCMCCQEGTELREILDE